MIGNVTCKFQEGFSRPGPPTSWQGASPSNGFEPHFSSTFGFFEDTRVDLSSTFLLNICTRVKEKLVPPQAEGRCSGNTSGECNIESPGYEYAT